MAIKMQVRSITWSLSLRCWWPKSKGTRTRFRAVLVTGASY